MKSIKWKLTKVFVLIMVCCIGSILLFNNLFLEKIYLNNKKDIIIRSYNAIEHGITESFSHGYTLGDLFRRNYIYENNETSLTKFLRELQETYGVSAVLMGNKNITYSIFQNNNRFDKRIMEYIFKEGRYDNSLEIIEENSSYKIAISTPRPHVPDGPGETTRPRFFGSTNRDSNLECFGFLSDGETAFLLTLPIVSIKEQVELFNKYLIILAVVILILGSIIIYIVSNNFSKPIVRLTEISKKMSRMEFQNKYTEKRNDEIGILGNTLNDLSLKLEKTIKELKNANIQLKKDIEKKTELEEMRKDFVANVSHELKTPLALIEGYAEGLEDSDLSKDKEKRDYYVSVIKDEVDKMNHMVKELLTLSQLERGQTEHNLERINLKEMVSGVYESLKIRFNDIKFDIDLDDIYVWFDAFKLEEVIRNYYTNAINHIDDKNYVKVYTENKDKKVRLCVFNSEEGLPDIELTKIWDKFYKVDKARTREYGGTGLGLSIVKAIADEHGVLYGAYNTQINNIKGIVFYIDLPIE